MTTPDLSTSLQLRRTFAAPRERVFHAWTEPKLIEQWFRPMGQRTKVAVLDFHVGGAYRFELINPSGKGSTIEGNFVEVVPPERLVFTWLTESTHGEQTLVTVEFKERDGLTEILLTHDRLADEAMVLIHKQGWESCIDLVAEVL